MKKNEKNNIEEEERVMIKGSKDRMKSNIGKRYEVGKTIKYTGRRRTRTRNSRNVEIIRFFLLHSNIFVCW